MRYMLSFLCVCFATTCLAAPPSVSATARKSRGNPPQQAAPSETEFLIADFDTPGKGVSSGGSLITQSWLESQPDGTEANYFDPIGANCTISLDTGTGIGGSDCLKVESSAAEKWLTSFYLIPGKVSGGSLVNFAGDDVYMLPRGMKANRIEMRLKFQDGFRETHGAGSGLFSLDIGTYCWHPGNDGSKWQETDGWHFYHSPFLRYDLTDGWFQVRGNYTPQHMRNRKAPVVNPTVGIPYVHILTRWYVHMKPYNIDSEIGYPCHMLVDDIKYIQVDEPDYLTCQFEDWVEGQTIWCEKETNRDFDITITNTSNSDVTGDLSERSQWQLGQKIFEHGTTTLITNPVTIPANGSKQFTVRINPNSDRQDGAKYQVGVAFHPDSENTTDNQSTVDSNVEQRKWDLQGGFDSWIVGCNYMAKIGTATQNNPPEGDCGNIFETPTNTQLSDSVTAGDPDGDALTYSVTENPTLGTLSMMSDGSFTYDPATDDQSVQRFEWKANDGTDDSRAQAEWIKIGDGGL